MASRQPLKPGDGGRLPQAPSTAADDCSDAAEESLCRQAVEVCSAAHTELLPRLASWQLGSALPRGQGAERLRGPSHRPCVEPLV